MQLKIKDLGSVFKKAFKEWLDKDPFRQSAVIAYYAIFSLPGLLVLIIIYSRIFFWKRFGQSKFIGSNFQHHGGSYGGTDCAGVNKSQ